MGSIVSVVATSLLAPQHLSGVELYLMWFASGLYLLAVQGPAVRFNIPLNNAVQALDIASMSDAELAEARARFEAPWNRWNRFRTCTATLAVVALLLVQVVQR